MGDMMDLNMIKTEIIDIDDEEPKIQSIYSSYETPTFYNNGDTFNKYQIEEQEMKLPILIDTRSLSEANRAPDPPIQKNRNKIIIGTKKKTTNYNAVLPIVDCRGFLLKSDRFCKTCKVLFKTKNDFMVHNYNVHTKDIFETRKSVNNKVSEKKENFKKNNVLTGPVKPVPDPKKKSIETCDLCLMKFDSKQLLVKHIYEHAKINFKNNRLKLSAGKQAVDQKPKVNLNNNKIKLNSVKLNTKINTNSKPLPEVQSKLTKDKTEITKQTTSDSKTMKALYNCNLCKKKFTFSGLRKHGSYHVNRGDVKYNTKAYGTLFNIKTGKHQTHKCRFCFKTSHTISGIFNHLRVHNKRPLEEYVLTLRNDVNPKLGGEQMFKCKLCGKTYAAAKSVNKHLFAEHNNPKPWYIYCISMDNSKWVGVMDS